ncbi:hypothetical protein [Streptomyces sp. NPDC055794]
MQGVGAFLGQGKFLVQLGEVAVGSGAGECLGNPALDVRDTQVLFLEVAQAFVVLQQFFELGAVEPEAFGDVQAFLLQGPPVFIADGLECLCLGEYGFEAELVAINSPQSR